MGGGLEIAGGAGGVAARYDDMLLHAGALDRIGDDLAGTASMLAGLAISPDLGEASVLCPLEVARAEAALVSANFGPGGVAVACIRAETAAAYLRFSVEAYRDVDALLSEVGRDAIYAGGLVAGMASMPLLVGAAVSLAAVGPLLDTQGKQLIDGGQQSLYDNPWLAEAATRAAPGFIEGAVLGIAGGRPDLLMLISGGNWPTAHFGAAVQGVAAVGGLFDAFEDSGEFMVAPTGPPRDVDFCQNGFAGQVMSQQVELSQEQGRVQIVTVAGASGAAYIVQIPGTQDWSPSRGDNPIDLTSNVNLAAGKRTKIEAAVIAAMHAAGIPADAPVMLTGHSQGGIVAAAIAADPEYRTEFDIKAVVTAGSPIGHVEIPADVSVLSLEHAQDLVPKLDGAGNPDQPRWVTVTRDLSDGLAVDVEHNLASAHSLLNYRQTAQQVDAATDPTVARWRAENVVFFGSGSAQSYQISPVVSPR